MARDTVNLYAETDRGIISDDTGSALNLENTSTGSALALKNTSSGNCLELKNASGTGIQLSSVSAPTTAIDVLVAGKAAVGSAVRFRSAASLGNALELGQSVVGSPTVALLVMTNSCASGAFFEFKGMASLVSMTSIFRGVRVKVGDEYGWFPVYASATFT